MKKILAITAGILLLLVVTAFVGTRIFYKKFVESTAFRGQVSTDLTQEAQRFAKNISIEVTSVKVTGLIDLKTGPVIVRSGDQVIESATIKSVLVRPDLWSLVSAGPLQATADVEPESGGLITVDGKISIALAVDQNDVNGYAEVSGKINGASALLLVELMQTAQKEPYFRLTEGKMNGSFHYIKRIQHLADPGYGRQNGYLTADLTDTQWVIASDSERIVSPEPLTLDLALSDFLIELRKPVRLTDDSGTATITGAVRLPRYRNEQISWDLKVTVDGSEGLLGATGLLFRCNSPPLASEFLVQGSMTAPTCEPAPSK